MHCIICRQEIKTNFVILSCLCKNAYHSECIFTWTNQNNNCPTCRHNWKLNPYQHKIKLINKINQRLYQESVGINSDRLNLYL